LESVIKWLLKSDPWVAYRTRIDLLDQSESEESVQYAKQKTINHPHIVQLLDAFSAWPEETVTNHKNAGLLIHRLAFLAEIGLTPNDANLKTVIDTILMHRSKEGVIEVPVKIPQHFGGSGEKTWGWALCDAPLVHYSLLKMGAVNQDIKKGVGFFKRLMRDNGWPCCVSPELGKFRGPGRKDDPCPYATLLMLKALSLSEEDRESEEAHIGAECLLDLWDRSYDTHPYIFYMGTDFRKLKMPFVWYDILNVADVLTCFDWLRNDARLKDMLNKADGNGLFTAESIWTAWKNFEFAQKKQPSPWLTFCTLRLLKRAGQIEIPVF